MQPFTDCSSRKTEGYQYTLFTEKFKPKKTTDDCYTPPVVYEAIADWVAQEYNLDKSTFFRPFYPGGDFESEDYTGKVVVDNPPFSIMARILATYTFMRVPFFLFAPALTLFSNSADVTYLPCGVTITYENGAEVATSFVTNLEDPDLVVRSIPELYRVVDEANKKRLSGLKKGVSKYEYPDHILTAAMVQRWCKYGIPYSLLRDRCGRIGALDSQRAVGKSIFGNGFILSERAAAERATAERAAAERAAAERATAVKWPLSDREKAVIELLTNRENRKQEEDEHG